MDIQGSGHTPFESSAVMSVFLARTLDLFSGAAAVAGLLSLVRIEQFGLSYVIMFACLVVLCILPTVVLRQSRHLVLRGYLIIAGFMIAMYVGIFNLGLTAGALFGIPLFLGIHATLCSRNSSYIAVAATFATLSVISYLFLSGRLTAPDPGLDLWNQSTANWMVAIGSNAVVAILFTTTIHNLRDSWKVASNAAVIRTRQLEEIIETAPDAITIFDGGSEEILTVNARALELFGNLDEKHFRGTKIGDLIFGMPQAETNNQMRSMIEATARDGSRVFETTIENSEGVAVPCEISMVPLPMLGPSLIRASILDISARVAAQELQLGLQEKLAASQRLEAIGKLTGGVAHDFNNLLAVIMGNLELLQTVNESEHDEQLLQSSVTAAQRGADLVASMLAFARKAPLQPKVENVNRLVQDTHAWAGPTIPSNIEIETAFDEQLWHAQVDETALGSALLNLILNAKDAMPDGGKLTVSTSNQVVNETVTDSLNVELTPGRYVMIEVTDTGAGIAPDTMGKIFDPFFTTKGRAQGSGLGLPMVFGFVGQSGGVVHVFSEEGKGTSVMLYFPALTNIHDESLDTDPQDAPTATPSARILLVEDNVELAKILARSLETEGYRVHTAISGDAARALFAADQDFDLLLTDLVMPGSLQGKELAVELTAIKPSLPVIFMSGNAQPQNLVEGGDAIGIHLSKPVPRQKLKEAVCKALAGS